MLSRITKGRLAAVGFTFTCTKTYTLSLASNSILVASVVAIPSTFILKADPGAPISLTDERRSFWLFSLTILKIWLTEPVVGKTVSYFKVSAVIVILASAEVIKESFLQAVS